MVDAGDVDFVDEADLGCFFGVFRSADDFEGVDASIEDGLGFIMMGTLKGPRMVPFHYVMVISSAELDIWFYRC